MPPLDSSTVDEDVDLESPLASDLGNDSLDGLLGSEISDDDPRRATESDDSVSGSGVLLCEEQGKARSASEERKESEP